jgi:hypothetical protein
LLPARRNEMKAELESSRQGGIGRGFEWLKIVGLFRRSFSATLKIIKDVYVLGNSDQKIAGVTQLARVTAFQAVGRGFESRLPLQ